jgi:hypothetical protein
MAEKRNVYRVLVGKSEGKRSLGSSRLRLEDDIKMEYTDRMELYGLDSSGSG